MEPGEVAQNGTAEPAFCLLEDESSFCVTLKEGGKTGRTTDSSPEEYLAAIQDSTVAWADFAVKDLEQELEGIGISMGFQRIPYQKLLSGFYSSYEDYDTELGIMLPAVSMTENDMAVHPIVILIRGNFIVTIHREGMNRLLKFSRYAQPFFKKIAADSTPDRVTLVLERIIDENNDRNFDYLRGIEAHGDSISKSLIEEKISKQQIAKDIYNMKHVLINYLNVLWATKDVIESLSTGILTLLPTMNGFSAGSGSFRITSTAISSSQNRCRMSSHQVLK